MHNESLSSSLNLVKVVLFFNVKKSILMRPSVCMCVCVFGGRGVGKVAQVGEK